MPIVKCGACDGTGTCPKCNGNGYLCSAIITYDVNNKKINDNKVCPRCGGNCSCTGCNGSGWIKYSKG